MTQAEANYLAPLFFSSPDNWTLRRVLSKKGWLVSSSRRRGRVSELSWKNRQMKQRSSATKLESGTPAEGKKKRRDEVILDALERLLVDRPLSQLDVEIIAAEAGITRARFYAYYTSRNDAFASLLRRLVVAREGVAEHPGSWFAGRHPSVRPRIALRKTIGEMTDGWWPHRFVLREACDLWTAVPEVRDTWLNVLQLATSRIENAILRERAVGVAPSGYSARRIAEILVWQGERLHFRSWAELPSAMTKKQLCEASLESFMRMIYMADDPDPEEAP